jgi:hypothetical protein
MHTVKSFTNARFGLNKMSSLSTKEQLSFSTEVSYIGGACKSFYRIHACCSNRNPLKTNPTAF